MFAAPVMAFGVGGWIAYVQPTALWVAGPLLAAWLLAPALSILSMRPAQASVEAISPDQRRKLRKVAHRTWQFFERFTGPESHWLPPDNYHEAPEVFVSQRTSPTNIGLMLLATVAAYDLGYLGITTLVSRLRYSFESLKRLERHRGHFLNWYRLDDLTSLEPRYVSAVDSGNLAASLIALRSALLEMEQVTVPIAALSAGTIDIMSDLDDTLSAIGAGEELQHLIGVLIGMLANTEHAARWYDLLGEIEREHLPKLQDMALAALGDHADRAAPEELAELRLSFNVLVRQLESSRHECDALMPWLKWPKSLGADAPPDAQQAFEAIRDRLHTEPAAVMALCTQARTALDELSRRVGGPATGIPALKAQLLGMRHDLDAAERNAQALRTTMLGLIDETDAYLSAMDFAFLYNPDRHLLRLGYTVTTGEFDQNHYDLLASEARLASFVAILKGDLPLQHWLHLGRTFARVGSKRVLVSWSATAFEYLMPHVLMHAPAGSLVTESCRVAIEQQQAFAAEQNVPWGISESGFYQLDKQAHYQYRAFGVPKLGLRAESDFRLVIAPYASLLALPFAPQETLANLERLEELNMLGRFGLFEAVDFGRTDAAEPRRPRVVRSYMSHHQGMIMAALDNVLEDGAMVRRFHANSAVASHAHLLFEQIPRGVAAPIGWRDGGPPQRVSKTRSRLESWHPSGQTLTPQLNVLSNGHYQATLSHFGLGTSFFDGVCLTHWQPDPCDPHGTCLYLKDLDSQQLWSAGTQPIAVSRPSDHDVRFAPHLAEFHRRDHGIHVRLDITVAPNDDVEIRRVTLTNDADVARRLELVSYAEPVLTGLEDHERHPAFSKLFIETTTLADAAVLARRRPRDENESPIYLVHAVCEFGGHEQSRTTYLDRREFLGRGGSVRAPAVFAAEPGLKETQHDGFDPAIAVGIEVELPPRAIAQVVFVFAAGRSRAVVLQHAADYKSQARVEWAFHQAAQRSERLLTELSIEPHAVGGMLQLFSAVRGLDPRVRGHSGNLARADAIRSMLWSRGISGDLPILMVHVRSSDDLKAAEHLVRTHTFWDRQQIAVDLVILDEEMGGYALPTRNRLARLVEGGWGAR